MRMPDKPSGYYGRMHYDRTCWSEAMSWLAIVARNDPLGLDIEAVAAQEIVRCDQSRMDYKCRGIRPYSEYCTDGGI